MMQDRDADEFTLRQLYEEIIKSKKEVKNSIAAAETRLILEIHSLKNRLDHLEKENITLKEKLEYADRINRKNNIIIYGFNKAVNGITPGWVCDELRRLLKVDLTEDDINDCYILGKKESSPIKLELISNLKKKVIFSKAKQLKGTPVSISNDLTEDQRREYKILRTNLLKARTETTVKSYIRGNHLIIGTKEYTAKDLLSSPQEKKTYSAPSTPSASGNLENLPYEDNQEGDEAGWETVEDNVEASSTADPKAETPNLSESKRAQRNPKASKKKSPVKKDTKSDFEALGVINPKRLYRMKETALTRTFSTYDFSSCQCKLILNFAHGEVSRHYRYAGQYSQMVKAMFKYSKSCLDLENTPETFITLNVVREHLKTKGISADEPYWKLRLFEGKIYSLRGRALLQTNQNGSAEYNLLRAMELYGVPFPKSNLARYIKSYSLKLKQKFALYLCPDIMNKQLKHYEAEYLNDVAECLHWLTQLYLEKKVPKKVELAAIWGLHCALKANYEFSMICKSFTNMLMVAQENRNTFHCLALEIHSLRYCHKKITNIDSDDLRHVAELYHAIGGLRRSRAEIDKAIYIGYITLRLAISVNHLKLVLKVIPRQVLLLMLKCYLPEACSMLNELDYYSSEADCNNIDSGRLSFHVVCLRFQIETGYTFIPYKESEKFNYEVNLQLAALNDPIARIEFVSLMWLWNCRNGRWEYTSKWKNSIDSYVQEIFENPTFTPYSIMYVLEGYLLSLVHSKNSQNMSSHKKLDKIIRKLFSYLENASKFSKFILPRLKHFQAYYEYIKGDEEKALKMLENALIYAAKCENPLELVHINHSKLAWSRQMPRSTRDKWITHCDEDNLLDYRLLEGYDDKIICFTLPKPIYA